MATGNDVAVLVSNDRIHRQLGLGRPAAQDLQPVGLQYDRTTYTRSDQVFLSSGKPVRLYWIPVWRTSTPVMLIVITW
jgi:hypothetical protein